MEALAAVNNKLLLKLIFSNGSISISEVELTGDNAGAMNYASWNGRVYWISGAYSSNQKICYTDFTSQIKSKPIMGKPIASSIINIVDDGSVIYRQYLAGSDTGTFAWNIDIEDSPRLLGTNYMDVKQVVNIDTL